MDIQKLLESMTLGEKLAELSQYNAICLHLGATDEVMGPARELNLTKEELMSVGSVLNFADATEMIGIQREHMERTPHGIPLLFMHDVIHGYRTIYPIPLALGASFDPSLSEECCAMAAREMKTGGVHVTFAPMVDLARDPRWGRCMETTGEDPYLNSDMARAMVRGYHKEGAAACVKHFAAYGNAEAGRDYNTTDMSERTLRDYYLPAYRAAVEEGVDLVMTSYNILNGVPSSGNVHLVKEILRGEWGFEGIVISDYNAFHEMHIHGYCADERECAARAIAATSDIEMMSTCYLKNIPDLIRDGVVREEQIDQAVLRVLRLKQRLGLFEDPYRGADPEQERKVCLSEEHRAIARRAVERTAVLLKNDGILPLDKEKCGCVAVIGPFAERVQLGGWECHGKESEGVTLFDGVKSKIGIRRMGFAAGCGSGVSEDDLSAITDAACLAASSDTVILCLGEESHMSGESMSRTHLGLSPAQQKLLEAVTLANKNTVVVLFSGRPLVLTDVAPYAPAIVAAWQPGTEGGSGLANLLFGEVNFTAKLPMTFPRSEGQIPLYYNHYRTGRPTPGPYGSWYIDSPNEPLYPFGYGLSYTTFTVSAPTLDRTELKRGEVLHATVTVTNTGEREGEETVQLYLCDRYASLARPVRELKGYRKVALAPGESKTVTFDVTEDLLKFWTENNEFAAEEGEFDLWIAASSDAGESVTFTLRA